MEEPSVIFELSVPKSLSVVIVPNQSDVSTIQDPQNLLLEFFRFVRVTGAL